MGIETSTGSSWNFVGSQTSTGPASVNNWTQNAYWNGDRYKQDQSSGAVPSGYYEICLPDKARPAAGGINRGTGWSWFDW